MTNFIFLCKDFVVDLYCGSAGGGGGGGGAILAFEQTGLELELGRALGYVALPQITIMIRLC